MKHELFSVWKETPAVTPSTPWKVQFPKGILSFKTKKKATAVADEAKRIAVSIRTEQAGTFVQQEYVL